MFCSTLHKARLSATARRGAVQGTARQQARHKVLAEHVSCGETQLELLCEAHTHTHLPSEAAAASVPSTPTYRE